MVFTVTATGPDGEVAFATCDSAAMALNRALSLHRNGMTAVLIGDADGRQYPPAIFRQRFVQA